MKKNKFNLTFKILSFLFLFLIVFILSGCRGKIKVTFNGGTENFTHDPIYVPYNSYLQDEIFKAFAKEEKEGKKLNVKEGYYISRFIELSYRKKGDKEAFDYGQLFPDFKVTSPVSVKARVISKNKLTINYETGIKGEKIAYDEVPIEKPADPLEFDKDGNIIKKYDKDGKEIKRNEGINLNRPQVKGKLKKKKLIRWLYEGKEFNFKYSFFPELDKNGNPILNEKGEQIPKNRITLKADWANEKDLVKITVGKVDYENAYQILDKNNGRNRPSYKTEFGRFKATSEKDNIEEKNTFYTRKGETVPWFGLPEADKLIFRYFSLKQKDPKGENKLDLTTYKFEKDTVIYPIYTELQKIKIDFDSRGGSQIAPFEIYKDSSLANNYDIYSFDIPRKDNCEFLGWEDANGNYPEFRALLNKDIKFYAIWKEKKNDEYYVEFKNSKIAPKIIRHGQKLSQPYVNLFTETNHIFIGWFDTDSKSFFDFDEPIRKNLTLEAKLVNFLDCFKFENLDGGIKLTKFILDDFIKDKYPVNPDPNHNDNILREALLQYNEIVINPFFNNTPITVIGEKLFEGKNQIKKITLGSEIKKIENINAFSDTDWFNNAKNGNVDSDLIVNGILLVVNPATTEIKFEKDKFINIAEGAFDSALELKKLIFDKDFEIEFKKGLFKNLLNLEEVVLPEKLVEIPDELFKGCKKIIRIDLSKLGKLTKIGKSAFEGCLKLEKVIFNEKYQKIDFGSDLFKDTKFLTDQLNRGFFILNQTLIKVADHIEEINFGKSSPNFDILKNVIIISSDIFNQTSNIKKISFGAPVSPDKTIEIKSYAFRNARKLESVFISEQVLGIGSYIFEGCEKLIDLVGSRQGLDKSKTDVIRIVGSDDFTKRKIDSKWNDLKESYSNFVYVYWVATNRPQEDKYHEFFQGLGFSKYPK